MQKTIAEINHYTSVTVNPLSLPEQTYELYSVPSYDLGLPEIIQGKEIGSTKVAVRENDVLVCKINPRINRVWVVKHHTQHPLIASSEWIVIRSPENDCEYLKWYFMSPKFHRMMVSQVTGIGGSLTRAQPKQVATYPVPIPDLPTQRRIAATLDKVSEGIALCKQMLVDLDELVKSQFVEMFGDMESNPKKWRESTVGRECYYIKDGPHKSPPYVDEGIPFISTRNVVNGDGIDWSTAKHISEADYFECIKKCKPEKGNILYSKGGTTGIAKLIETDKRFANWVHVAVLKFGEQLNGKFFECMLNMDYCYQQSQRLTKGIANRDFVLSAIAQVKIFVPPIGLQEQYERFVRQTDKSKFALQQQLAELETLKKSLMQKYFSEGNL